MKEMIGFHVEMKKYVCLFILGVALCVSGCGNSNEDKTEYVEVEIEKIEDIVPVVENIPQTSEASSIDNGVGGTDLVANESVTTDLDASLEDALADGGGQAGDVMSADGSAQVDSEGQVGDAVLSADGAGTDSDMQVDNENDIAEGSEETPLDSIERNANNIYVVVVGNTPAEILEVAREELSLQGLDLQIVNRNGYSSANDLVSSQTVDASLCVNQAYMDSYNTIHGTSLAVVQRQYYEPLALFPGKTTNISRCPSGAVIAIPKDGVLAARSLYLLSQKGLINLKDGAGYQACVDDIETNPRNIKIETYDISSGIPFGEQYDFVVSDFNRAIISGVDPKTAVGCENRNSELLDLFTINLVANKGDVDSAKIQKLAKALETEKVEAFVKNTYMGCVVDYR